jgi:hypothetical protein
VKGSNADFCLNSFAASDLVSFAAVVLSVDYVPRGNPDKKNAPTRGTDRSVNMRQPRSRTRLVDHHLARYLSEKP